MTAQTKISLFLPLIFHPVNKVPNKERKIERKKKDRKKETERRDRDREREKLCKIIQKMV